MQILLVEDDHVLADSLATALTFGGHTVKKASRMQEVFRALQEDRPELILLDILLPDGSGLDVLQAIRQTGTTPVILMSALDTDPDVIRGLDLGANDYITKPFSIAVLQARIRAVTRSVEQTSGPRLACRDLILNPDEKSISYQETPIAITRTEYEILSLLISHVDTVVRTETLYQAVWNYQFPIGSTNPLAVNISTIRKKLKAATGEEFIETVFGRGYIIRSQGEGRAE